MKYVKFTYNTIICGVGKEKYMAFKDDIAEEELSKILGDIIYESIASFQYRAATRWGDDFESEEESYWFDDCSGEWEFVSEEEYYENVKE